MNEDRTEIERELERKNYQFLTEIMLFSLHPLTSLVYETTEIKKQYDKMFCRIVVVSSCNANCFHVWGLPKGLEKEA